MTSLAGDVDQPPLQADARFTDVLRCMGLEVVVLDVAHRRLDLALLLRAAWWSRVDDEAIVSRQFAVAAVERGFIVDAERRTDDGRLEVVGDDRLRHATELFEALDVQAQPGLDLLVEDDAHGHVP